jgi:hypothetical protein
LLFHENRVFTAKTQRAQRKIISPLPVRGRQRGNAQQLRCNSSWCARRAGWFSFAALSAANEKNLCDLCVLSEACGEKVIEITRSNPTAQVEIFLCPLDF